MNLTRRCELDIPNSGRRMDEAPASATVSRLGFEVEVLKAQIKALQAENEVQKAVNEALQAQQKELYGELRRRMPA